MDGNELQESLEKEILNTIKIIQIYLSNGLIFEKKIKLLFPIGTMILFLIMILCIVFGILKVNFTDCKIVKCVFIGSTCVCFSVLCYWYLYVVTMINKSNKLLKILIRAEQNIRLSEIELKKFEKKPYKVEVKISK